MNAAAQSIQASDQCRDQVPVRVTADRSKPVRFEEQGEDPVVLGRGDDWPGRCHQLSMARCRRSEGGRERFLQLETHRQDHLADEILLAREVVHDGAVADAEPLRQPTEGQLTEPVVERCSERAIEHLRLRMPRTHALDCSGHYV